MPKTQKPTLLQALNGASVKELNDIGEQIADLEKQLDTLRLVHKLLDVRINGKPERKAPVRTAKKMMAEAPAKWTGGRERSNEVSSQVANVVAYLRKVGSAKPAIIASDCNIPAGSIYNVLAKAEFQKGLEGFYKLAEADDE